MRLVYKWIILFLIISACNYQKENISFQYIDIENKTDEMEVINLSCFNAEVSYVPLETSDNMYLSWISECDFHGDYMLISNLVECLLYDNKGKFIIKIGAKGRGPGEYQFVQSACFDKDTNVYVQSLFERERPVASGFEDHAHIYYFNNKVFYKEFYNDTLFWLNEQKELVPHTYFKLGKYKEPVSERAKLPQEGSSMSDYLYVWNAFQTDNHMFIDCQFGHYFPAKRVTPKKVSLPNGQEITITINTNRALGIYNKEIKRLSFCKPTTTDNPLYASGIFNDIDAGPKFFPTKLVNDSTMVMWIRAEELIGHVKSDDFKNNIPEYPEKKKHLEAMTGNLSILDNPVLMFVTFRK